ncbi:MAG: hypothetical protein NVS4B9_07180 [Ktedonobacteraceae bacterium]
MEPTAPQSLQAQLNTSDNQNSIKKSRSSKLFQQPGAWLTHDMDVSEDKTTQLAATHAREQEREVAVTEETQTIESMQTQKVPALNHFTHNMLASAQRIENREAIERIETNKIPTPVQYPLFSPVQLNNAGQVAQVAEQQAVGQPYAPTYGIETPQAWYMPVYPPTNNFVPEYAPVYPPANNFGPGYAPVFPDIARPTGISKERAAILIALLCIILLQALNVGPTQFLGPQGWSYVLAGPGSTQSTHLLNPLAQSRAARDPKGKTAVDPQRAIDTIIGQMSMDQKIGQMMMIQFIGADYSLQLSTMISQYSVGSVLLFYANGNIVAKDQLRTLTQQIQRGSTTLPIAISIDQEGGAVDRLVQLDGPRPSEASIGATNDPTKAMQAGLQDAQDLSSYGITLNLAPVVDVDNLSTSEMHRDNRTYGTNPAIVSSMAGAYLKGLQQSGKVVGTLKHFPGLGYVNVDPHFGIPRLNRTKDAMEQIDWSPYRTLIQQGQVHAIMVTHEILPAIDATRPSSLSPQVVQGILRDEMHFQGVIMTDSLTMAGITEYYTPGQAAAIAVEAGSDMIMGANSPTELGMMIDGIKQAMSDGTISTMRIDASVRRILMMKYQMGLLSIAKN